MIEGENFLVFGDDWGVYPNTTEHLLRRLVSRNRFLWVHMYGLRAPQWNLYDLRRAQHKVLHWIGVRANGSTSDDLALYSPFLLPFSTSRVAHAWNRFAVVRGVRRRLQRLNLQNPIFFASFPNAAEVLGAFEEKLVVYLCEDEWAEMPGIYRRYVREMEDKLLERADLVVVTSKPLLQTKAKPNRPTVLLPQGVEFEHFSQFQKTSSSLPSELAEIPRPRIGFVGLLAAWVDVDLLVAVAQAYSRASVVVIGPVRTDITPLNGQKNIFLIGPRSYTDLPRYLAHFDVGLIPFHQNRLTRYVNPLKLLEYLASGLPVVSTAMPDVEAYGNVVYCARERDEFVGLVGLALNDQSDEQRRRRVSLARENSWEQRAEQLSQQLESALRKRKLQ